MRTTISRRDFTVAVVSDSWRRIRTLGGPLYSASCRFHVAADARNASDAGGPCTPLHALGAFAILFRLRNRRPTLFRTVPAP